MKAVPAGRETASLPIEFMVASAALIALLAGQWMLSAAIQGSNYLGWDGKMAQAMIIAGLKYTGWFQLNNISPIEGVGSQMLTMNVWANPSFWPFAAFDKELATDVSALVALGIFMTCCYLMARCFDVPVVPSALAAQLCILIFAPALLIYHMPTNFCLTPGDAVVAVVGYWSVPQGMVRLGGRLKSANFWRAITVPPGEPVYDRLLGVATARSRLGRGVVILTAVTILAVVPARAIDYALNDSGPSGKIYYEAWPHEPELMKFLAENVSSQPGQTLRGSLLFYNGPFTLVSVWANGMHTVNENSQLVTPQAVYFLYKMLKQNVTGTLNGFMSRIATPGAIYAKVVQLLGAHYYLTEAGRVADADQAAYQMRVFPRDSPHDKQTGEWWVYDFPHTNVGNYSPTEVATAQSAAAAIDKMSPADFDFTRQVVLASAPAETLVAAHDMRLSRIRGGFHISGESEGTSLIVLPLQFSHCLRADDESVHFVRADLLMAGMIFSQAVDTDIVFDYGIFSSRCRRADLAEFKKLDMKIDLRMPHLTDGRTFVDWPGAVARFRQVAVTLGLVSH